MLHGRRPWRLRCHSTWAWAGQAEQAGRSWPCLLEEAVGGVLEKLALAQVLRSAADLARGSSCHLFQMLLVVNIFDKHHEATFRWLEKEGSSPASFPLAVSMTNMPFSCL